MRIIYFVRHGETNSNVLKRGQGADDELSPRGEIQAEQVAERMQSLTFDALLSSPMQRAQQTASCIAARTEHEVATLDVLAEVLPPQSTIGTIYAEEEGNPGYQYLTAREEHADDPTFRYEDEETVAEIVARARRALEEVAAVDAERIVVVTHGSILRTMLNVVTHGGVTDDPRIIYWAGRQMRTANTGISVVTKHTDEEPWQLLTFNDHAHFADT